MRRLLACASLLLITPAMADTALFNVNGYTSTDDGMKQFSVLIFDRSGRVIATSDDALIQQHADAERLDGKGRTVLPGLTDAHAHVAGLGFLKTSLDLAGVPSVEDAVARIAQYARDKPHAR